LPFMHKKNPFQYADIPKGAFDTYWEKRSRHRFYSFRYTFGSRWTTLIKGGYTTTRSTPVLMVPLFVQMLIWLKIKHFFKPRSFLFPVKIILKQKRPLSARVTERGLEFHAEKIWSRHWFFPFRFPYGLIAFVIGWTAWSTKGIMLVTLFTLRILWVWIYHF